MRVGMGSRMRKALASLLVLALLALSAPPASAWPMPATGHGDGHHAAADCGPHDFGAVPAPPGEGPPCGHHDHAPPALACCAALHCPMLLADLRPAPAPPMLPAGLRVRAAIAVWLSVGIDIAPALPPPRDAA